MQKQMKTKLERIEKVIKYYYDRGTNREKCNEIKRKLLKYEKTLSTEEWVLVHRTSK